MFFIFVIIVSIWFPRRPGRKPKLQNNPLPGSFLTGVIFITAFMDSLSAALWGTSQTSTGSDFRTCNTPEDESLIIDVSDACISRSAKDEFYKSFVSVSSPFADRCTIVGEDIDFILKMKAVKRSQNVRKHLRTFSQEQIITVTTADEMAEVARLFS